MSLLDEPIARMSRDIRKSAETLGTNEARYLVDTYYQMQDARIRDDSRIRQQVSIGEPHSVLLWLRNQDSTLEGQIKGALGRYAAAHPIGEWCMSIVGIGPVIAAGLLCNIDINRCPTAGSLWKFAGLDGTPKRPEKGVKRGFSASFKVLTAFKLGESFVKVQNHPEDVYGKVYAARKLLEQERNSSGLYAEQASHVLATRKIGKETDAFKHYSAGRLPPAQIHARARRYAVKLFLSHLHEVWYWHEFGEVAPKPYAFEHLGHAHIITPPNFDRDTFPVLETPRPIPKRRMNTNPEAE